MAVALTVGLVLFMGRTKIGLAIRATGMDRAAARLMGMNVRHVYAFTFGLAAALAGMAGAIIGSINTFSPAAAGGFTLQSFVIAVLGGLGNMWGALAGGLLLGLVQAWGGQYLSGTLVNAIAFGVLVLVLIVRPVGPDRPALLRGQGRGVSSEPAVAAPRRELPRFPAGRGWLPWAGAVAVLVVLALAPTYLLLDSEQRTLGSVFMFVVLAQGWNLIGGFAGYPSFGNVVFFGLGGYTTAVLMAKARADFWVTVPAAAAVGAGFAVLMGIPILRL